jgi:Uncharacterized protein conserved in bacteria
VTRINRRRLLWGAGAGAVLASVGAVRFTGSSTRFLSAADDADGGHCLLGLDAAGEPTYCLPVPYRAHEARALDDRLAIYFARRPGRQCYVVEMRAGALLATLEAQPGEHFCGHGVVSADGRHLFLTTYAFERQMGVVAIHETAPPFARVGQIDTHGLDPHQLALLPDGATLVVANGGILTHPDSEREMLNLDSMDPSLVYLQLDSGELLEQLRPPHHQISLRHLTVGANGTVVIGAQDHASGIEANPHPLVFQHSRGGELRPFDATASEWRQMNQYIASMALSADGQVALSTTPRGNCISLWDMAGNRHIRSFPVRDVAGASWVPKQDSFLVSNGLGQMVYLRLQPEPRLELVSRSASLRWDNHLILV